MQRIEKTHSNPPRFLRSDQVRPRLSRECELVARGAALDFGSSPDNPIFRLAPLSWISDREREQAVRVTADRARKGWTELRAAVRYHDLRFVITVRGQEVAFLQRHSSYALKRLPGWLAESKKGSSSRDDRTKRDASQAAAQAQRSSYPNASPPRPLEDRFSDLEARVEELDKTTKSILRAQKIGGRANG